MVIPRTLSRRRLLAAAAKSNLPFLSPPMAAAASNAAKSYFHRQFTSSPEFTFFRRFLHQRSVNIPSSFLAGDNMREKLKSMNIAADNRLHLNDLNPPLPVMEEGFRVGDADVKRLLKLVRMEQIRERLRNIPASTIPFGELVQVCAAACGDRETGLEFAKALDESGNVVVLGGVVFLRPDQVAKSMEKLIYQSIGLPNDPRRQELDNLEKEKCIIDKKAQSVVKMELYGGLGFLVLQTLGFMRLTFWELSWDVMEPICFFVTSLHFAIAYAFFLRTSKEPSFESYFQRRFKLKQKNLMKVNNFDEERYNKLCEAFYPKEGQIIGL